MPQVIQRNFTSGEIAPALRARADLTKYSNGLAECENMFVRPQGGVYSRPGLRFAGELSDSNQKARLIPFSFNTEQTYILVLEHLKIRIIRDGGFILVNGAPLEITTTYTAAQLFDIGFAQSADVLTLAHRSHNPANLSRLSDTSWTLADISYAPSVSAPTFSTSLSLPITSITLSGANVVLGFTGATQSLAVGDTVVLSGIAGGTNPGNITDLNGIATQVRDITLGLVVTLELSAAPYSGDYGSGGVCARSATATTGAGQGDHDKTYQYVVTVVDEADVESLPSVPVSITAKSLSTTFGVRLSWGSEVAASRYRVYKDQTGDSGRYGWIGDATNSVFTDFNIAPLVSDSPPADRQPFSATNSKPSVVTYYQQRQVFGNTQAEPQTVYTTQIGNFRSFRTSTPARDDDAITFTMAAQQVNEVRHLIPLDTLVILTSGAEWRLTEGDRQVFTPSTSGVRVQSYNGASKVPPAVVNDSVLYLQDKGSKLRDLDYNFSNDRYGGNDLSIMSEHLFEGHTITQMAYAEVPYGILWCIRDDGVLLGLTYQKEHQVWGWHKHTTDGQFESVAVISEDDRDAAYFVIKRTVNGVTKRFIERMEPRVTSSREKVFALDSGLSYSGAPVSTVSGLAHLNGSTVSALVDGYVAGGLTVTNGAVTLPNPGSDIHVGLPFTCVFQTLDIDFAGMEPLKVKRKSMSEVNIVVQDSVNMLIGPVQDGGEPLLLETPGRDFTDGFSLPPLYTGPIEQRLDPTWAKSGAMRIEQRDPLPLAILAVIPDVSIGG